MLLLIYKFLYTYSHYTLLSVRTIIGHDYKFVAALSYLILQYNKVFAASCYNRKHTVASSFQGAYNRQHWSNSNATASTNHRTIILNMCRISKRTNYVCYVVALVKATQLSRRQANLLYNNGYSTTFYVGIGNGQRHTFAIIANADDYKVACLTALCNQWGFNLKKENLLRELFFQYDFVHGR